MTKKKKHKWKYRINIKKKVLVLLILGVSLFVGLGYAIINTNLRIGGILEVEKYNTGKSLNGAIRLQESTGCVKKYVGEHQDSIDSSQSLSDIYYFDCEEQNDMNNVVFANSCWKVVRTTDTGGVKLIYNGDVQTSVVDGETQYNCGYTRPTTHLSKIRNSSMSLYDIYDGTIFAKDYTSSVDEYGYTIYTLVYDPDDSSDHKVVNGEAFSQMIDDYNSGNKTSLESFLKDVSENYPYTCGGSSDTSCSNLTKIAYEKPEDIRSDFYVVAYGSGADYYAITGGYDYSCEFDCQNFYDSSSDGLQNVGYMYGDSYSGYSFNTSVVSFLQEEKIITSSASLRNTKYYYADSYDWNSTNVNQYTLLNSQLISLSTSASGVVGKYTFLNNKAYPYSESSVKYIVGSYSSYYVYYKTLTNGNNDVSIRFADSIKNNGDGTYSLNSSGDPVDLKTYYTNYRNYANKYTCGDSSTTCSSPRYITSTTSTNYKYVSGEMTIAKSINGFELNDYETISLIDWYKDSAYRARYNDYIYTCGNTDTVCNANNLRYIYSRSSSSYSYYNYYYFGNSVIWENNKYKLQDVKGIEDFFKGNTFYTHRYMCLDIKSTECSKVAYFYNRNGYIIFENQNVTSVEDALDIMLRTNTKDSFHKKIIDKWYEKNIKDTKYEALLDDTIFCNDRSYATKEGYSFEESTWNSNGMNLGNLYFRAYPDLYYDDETGNYGHLRDLSCPNVTDRFSVSNNSAKLKYKVGELTLPEFDLAENKFDNAGQNSSEQNIVYLTMTPMYLDTSYSYISSSVAHVSVNGKEYSIGYYSPNISDDIRPVISLNKTAKYIKGNGSMTNPYLIDEDGPVSIKTWKQTRLSDTSINSSGATTTINSLGSASEGNTLDTLEYYTTCTSGTPTGSMDNLRTAAISGSSATININACVGAVLHYRLVDSAGNKSYTWNHVSDIGEYLIYAQVYNHMIYAGGMASNNDENLTFWVNTKNFTNMAHRLISMGYYDDRSEATVNALDYNTIVEKAYPSFLGRNYDSTKSSWVTKLTNGEETIDSFFLKFINSTEAKGMRGAWGYDTEEYNP